MKAKELQIGDLVQICSSKYDETLINTFHPITGWSLKIGDVIPVVEILSNGINPEWDGQENYGHILEVQLAPIPLTAEMLKKNGFFVSMGSYPNRLFCNKQEEYCVEISDSVCSKGDFSFCVMQYSEFEPYSSAFICDCKYVHQLQHALRLVGLADIADNFKAEIALNT